MTEQEKYEALWGKFQQYRVVAPGEELADTFLQIAKPQPYQSIADFGCGTGRGAWRIRRMTAANVRMFDFTGNCLDPIVKQALSEGFSFTQHDLTQPISERFDIAYCTDVLEHIPPGDVDKVLTNIGVAARRLFLCISTEDDVCGALIGQPLHLTVKPAIWWHEKLVELGFRVDHSRDLGNAVMFYASVYANADDIAGNTVINVEHDVIRANVKANLSLGLQEIAPHQVQKGQKVYLLAGGPSLKDYEKQILRAGRKGVPIVTVNGTYNWLLERGIRPAAQVMVDARTFNKRFVTPLVDTCRYLISSTCDHEVLKSLPPEQTWLWHSGDSELVREALEEVSKETGTRKEYFPVYGGSTVVFRALTLLAMLGFRKVEVFGWDSCLREEVHHAYEQPENDQQTVVDVEVGGRTFKCHPWMLVQANEFPKVIKFILGQIPDFKLVVRGDGLIAHILEHASSLERKE